MGHFGGGLFGYGLDQLAQHHERKVALEDADRMRRYDDTTAKLNALAEKKKMGVLEPGDEKLAKDLELEKLQIFHPAQNPGALQRLWPHLKARITRQSYVEPPPLALSPSAAVGTTTTPDLTLSTAPESISLNATPDYRTAAIGPAGHITTTKQPGVPGVSTAQPAGSVTLRGGATTKVTAPEHPAVDTMAVPPNKIRGLIALGNLPIWSRPAIKNDDGRESTEFTTSFIDNRRDSPYFGKEVLLPTIVNGRFLSDDGKMPAEGSPEMQRMLESARTHYYETGEHLGVFDNAANADIYADQLHSRGKRRRPDPKTYGPTPAQRKLETQVEQANKEADEFLRVMPTEAQRTLAEARNEFAAQKAKIDDYVGYYKETHPGASDEEVEEYRRSLIGNFGGFKTTTGKFKSVPGKLFGKDTTLDYNASDGRWYRGGQLVPAEWVEGDNWKPDQKPIKKVKLGDVPSKQSPTGFAELWGDPSSPNDRSKWAWTPIAATRYQQTIQTSGQTTDPFGAVTTTGRTTGPASQHPVDLTGVGQQAEGYAGEEVAPGEPQAPAPPATPPPAPRREPTAGTKPGVAAAPVTPRDLKHQAPSRPVVTDSRAPVGSYGNPLPLDQDKHVPESSGMNPAIRAYVDQLLDGADIDKLGVPGKDKGLIAAAAEKYGWKQGLFTPKEKLLVREAGTFLKKMRGSESLNVLESWPSRQKIENAIIAADDKGGFFSNELAMTLNLSPAESDFVQQFLQIRGVIGGLSQLSRGGRTTEAGIKRLQSEIPNPKLTHSAAMARQQLDRLLSEITVAQQSGFIGDTEEDHVSNAVEALDRLFSSLPASAGSGQSAPKTPAQVAPPRPAAKGAPAPSGMKAGDIMWRQNPDGSKTGFRYKGGDKSDTKSYTEVPNAAAAH